MSKPSPGKANPRLPPMEDRIPLHPSPSRLPPINANISGTNPAYTGGAIISVPEGQGAETTATQQGMISVPGQQAATGYAPIGQRGQPTMSKPPLDIVVYFTDKKGVRMSIEDGQNVQAGELFELIMEEMKFPDAAREMFSLWLVSDLLELQLKPTHVPFKLACYWEELLTKYVKADEDDIERDEPVVMFQRNVYFDRDNERQCSSVELVKLLYHEAKENVIDGRYPVKMNLANQLAGMQALIDTGRHDPTIHDAAFFKEHIENYYSSHLTKKKSLFSRREKMEEHIVQAHQAANHRFGDITGNENKAVNVYKAYLEECWKLPYYGSAFFKGQIEHPGNPIFSSLNDEPVYIAVNTAGVFIIDMDDVEFLMGVLFEKLSWEFAEPKNKNNPNCLPCLFFTFVDVVGREKFTKVLQVFSKESKLADALIETCMRLKKARKDAGEDVVDGIVDEDGDGIIEPDGKRVCLTTLNSKGQITNSNARAVKPK